VVLVVGVLVLGSQMDTLGSLCGGLKASQDSRSFSKSARSWVCVSKADGFKLGIEIAVLLFIHGVSTRAYASHGSFEIDFMHSVRTYIELLVE
jgi:hypothetical protein